MVHTAILLPLSGLVCGTNKEFDCVDRFFSWHTTEFYGVVNSTCCLLCFVLLSGMNENKRRLNCSLRTETYLSL